MSVTDNFLKELDFNNGNDIATKCICVDCKEESNKVNDNHHEDDDTDDDPDDNDNLEYNRNGNVVNDITGSNMS